MAYNHVGKTSESRVKLSMSIPIAKAVAVPSDDFNRPPLVAYVSQAALTQGAGGGGGAAAAQRPPQDMWQARAKVLGTYNFPPGLSAQLNSSCDAFPMRYWIVDNSGSMATADGHYLKDCGGGKIKSLSCSRWEEVATSVMWHAELASKLCAPTEFRLLNFPGGLPSQMYTVGLGDNSNFQTDMAHISGMMSTSPTGNTPLCFHLNDIYQKILPSVPYLQQTGKKALVVVATDGESSDGDVARALEPFRLLPVWVVIRLCTDQENVVGYWNNIDDDIELDMDVLNDVAGEAQEVFEKNPWLNYGLNLHRLREFGCLCKDFDMLDERPLKPLEVKNAIKSIFGEDVPHPEEDWGKFVDKVKDLNSSHPQEWNFIKNRLEPWIDLRKLNTLHGTGTCSIS